MVLAKQPSKRGVEQEKRQTRKKQKTSNGSPSLKEPVRLASIAHSPPPHSSSGVINDGNSEASDSSRGVTRRPDVSVVARRRINGEMYVLPSIFGEVKLFPLDSNMLEAQKDAIAIEAYGQAILYLAAAWEACGTWLSFTMINSKFGRLAVVNVRN